MRGSRALDDQRYRCHPRVEQETTRVEMTNEVPWPDGVKTCGEISSDECNDRYFALLAEVGRLSGENEALDHGHLRATIVRLVRDGEVLEAELSSSRAEVERLEKENKELRLMAFENTVDEAVAARSASFAREKP